jgi:hypothetical protein
VVAGVGTREPVAASLLSTRAHAYACAPPTVRALPLDPHIPFPSLSILQQVRHPLPPRARLPPTPAPL